MGAEARGWEQGDRGTNSLRAVQQARRPLSAVDLSLWSPLTRSAALVTRVLCAPASVSVSTPASGRLLRLIGLPSSAAF